MVAGQEPLDTSHWRIPQGTSIGESQVTTLCERMPVGGEAERFEDVCVCVRQALFFVFVGGGRMRRRTRLL